SVKAGVRELSQWVRFQLGDGTQAARIAKEPDGDPHSPNRDSTHGSGSDVQRVWAQSRKQWKCKAPHLLWLPASSSMAQLVDSKRIEQLPLNGRNALQLVAMIPGVVNAGSGGQFGATQSTFSTSGGRNIDMNFTVAGGYNVTRSIRSRTSTQTLTPSDALQDFSTSTRNYRSRAHSTTLH